MPKVAVYGSLRQGLSNHPVLGKARLLSTERVDGFVMHSLSAFPVVYHSDNKDDSIVVEVYEVGESQLTGPLDRLESHNSDRSKSWYHRELVSTSQGRAWLYVMTEDRYRSNPIVENGDWFQFKTQ